MLALLRPSSSMAAMDSSGVEFAPRVFSYAQRFAEACGAPVSSFGSGETERGPAHERYLASGVFERAPPPRTLVSDGGATNVDASISGPAEQSRGPQVVPGHDNASLVAPQSGPSDSESVASFPTASTRRLRESEKPEPLPAAVGRNVYFAPAYQNEIIILET